MTNEIDFDKIRDGDKAWVRGTWKPIATAPRSGHFLAWDVHYGLPVIWSAVNFWGARDGTIPAMAWWKDDVDACTHWMPIPAAPAREGETSA